MHAEWFQADPDAWLRQIVAIHLDPDNGTAYWLAKEKEWGLDLRQTVRYVHDLSRLPIMSQEDLREHPVAYFVPKRFHDNRTHWIPAETGGTTGAPKTTVWQETELLQGFGEFWADVARARHFPFGANWLFVGPSGPHIIGKAAGVMANCCTSADPYRVDFDPRWIKRFAPDSAGAKSYQEHLIEQAIQVLDHQSITVIFTTPPVLTALVDRMSDGARRAIQGIHLGGLPVDLERLERFRNRDFQDAVIIPGYGNTLFGLTLEVAPASGQQLDYFGPGPRLILDVVEPGTTQSVAPGGAGQVLFQRLDSGFMILNMAERDGATKIPPSDVARQLGLTLDGVRNPKSLETVHSGARTGLY